MVSFLLTLPVAALADSPTANRPNVLVIITDDQGYGDLRFHGNPQIQTPRLDALARESVRLRSFYVMPVCSPTRAALMTGRYPYRTGVVDTFRGRSMMHPDEVTLAEILGTNGYRTGIFGKWHLGDNAPLRPIDQGFAEALVHRGGGIGQASDTPGTSYFDPILIHNGVEEKQAGYCSDIYASAAIKFIEADRSRPFFTYLAFNAPHEPLVVADADLAPYRGLDPYRGEPGIGQPLPDKLPAEDTAKVYAMVSNIDANVGRVLDRLDALGLTRETIVVFLTDNGPWKPRYNAGMRNLKGSVYDGGIRVPCFVRWPGRLDPGREVEPIASVIDLTPTLIEACGVTKPDNLTFDGRSLLPLLKGESVDWPDRILYVQWHRGDEPQARRAFAARSDRYKLVQPRGIEPGGMPRLPHFELFDMVSDPWEKVDVSSTHPDVVARMLGGYDAWFREVEGTRHFQGPRIQLGSPAEDPVTLTRQDWRGEMTEWEPDSLGGWDIEVVRAGRFDLEILYPGRGGGIGRGRAERRLGPRGVFPGIAFVSIGWVRGSEGFRSAESQDHPSFGDRRGIPGDRQAPPMRTPSNQGHRQFGGKSRSSGSNGAFVASFPFTRVRHQVDRSRPTMSEDGLRTTVTRTREWTTWPSARAPQLLTRSDSRMTQDRANPFGDDFQSC